MNPLNTNHNILFIGMGNRYRSDDGVGLYVAEELKKHDMPGLEIMEMRDDGYSMVEAWVGHPLVIVVDAMYSGRAPGTIQRIDALNEPLPVDKAPTSSHSISLGEAIQLGETLKRLPEQMILYAIEGRDFNHGSEMLPEVKGAGDQVVQNVLELKPQRNY